MEINMKSWHYRTANMFNWKVSNSLCVYFWQVVWGMFVWWFFMPVVTICAALIVLICLPCSVGLLLLKLFTHAILIGDRLHDGLWAMGAGYCFFAVFFAVIFIFVYLKEEVWKKRTKKDKTDKPDGLFVAYVKAKKSKICPILTFTTGDKK